MVLWRMCCLIKVNEMKRLDLYDKCSFIVLSHTNKCVQVIHKEEKMNSTIIIVGILALIFIFLVFGVSSKPLRFIGKALFHVTLGVALLLS